MMWETIVATVALLGSVTTIVLDEVSDIPEQIRAVVRGPATRSPSARIDGLETRLAALERKLSRPAA
jgi:hypothetical protein